MGIVCVGLVVRTFEFELLITQFRLPLLVI
jgi:hypothetical protein